MEKIGLALSGGGYRATLFHLGAMRRLHELGVLERVTHISGVSGGAITAAVYGLALADQERGLGGGKKLSSNDYDTAFEEFQRNLLEGIPKNFFAQWALQQILSIAVNLVSIFLPGPAWRAAGLFARLIRVGTPEIYKAIFYGETKLSDLPKSVRVILNATSLDPPNTDDPEKERLFYFTRDYIGSDEGAAFDGPGAGTAASLEAADGEDVYLAEGVAASSALPGVIVPYARRFRSGDQQVDAIYYLADGGVYDNEGFFVFLDEWEQQYPVSRCDYILCSDGAGRDIGGEGQAFLESLLWRVMPRTNTILQMITIMKDHIRSQNFALLRNKYSLDSEKTQLKQYATFHIRKAAWEDKNYRLPGRFGGELDFPMLLQGIRTQIDVFDSIEARALMYHGYTLMNSRLMRFCWSVLPAQRRNLYENLRANMFTEKQLRRDPPPSVKWSQIIEAENTAGVPAEEQLPDLKSWQEFNRELDAGLLGYRYQAQGEAFGQADFSSSDQKPMRTISQAFEHLRHSSQSIALARTLNRFASKGALAQITAAVIKLIIFVVLVSLGVLIIYELLERLFPLVSALRSWVLSVFP